MFHGVGPIGYNSKKKDKDQESIQSSTTPDPGYQWESNKHKTEITWIIHKKYCLETVSKNILLDGLTGFTAPPSPLVQMLIKTQRCLVCMKDPRLINALSPRKYKSRYKNEIKQR